MFLAYDFDFPLPGDRVKSGGSEVGLLGNAIAKQPIVLGFVLEQLPEFQPGWRNWQTRQT
jgi:hypothetical protein